MTATPAPVTPPTAAPVPVSPTEAAAAVDTGSAVDAATNVPAVVDATPPVVDATSPMVDAAHGAAHHAPALTDVFNTLGTNVVYLMGFSFILGSLFTVLILVLLDYLRRNKQ